MFTLEHDGVGALSGAVSGGSAPREKLFDIRSHLVVFARDTLSLFFPLTMFSFYLAVNFLGLFSHWDGGSCRVVRRIAVGGDYE